LQVVRNLIIDILNQDFEHLEFSFCGTRPKTDKFLNHVFRKDLQSLTWQVNSQNQYFTLDTLLTDAREKLEFEGGRTTLHKILKSMGYKYRLVNGRKIICEQKHVVAWKIVFLRKFIKLFKNQLQYSKRLSESPGRSS
jgi:hypothetical protein